ncbi:hypothetical protein [Flectobacillus roseus]|uniref:hypothetical protein n=1 Tax=Flectobacillus roseus TaxID=502259 RepID=UPI0024B84B89|nr:hypothetical protein [Flectobacillus roseus]MDI9872481.1 hypothetical protein [Flectobacillus roseus]
MEITIFGIFWIGLLLSSLFFNGRVMIFLLLLSCLFHATAIFIIAKKGITPTFVTEIFTILRFSYHLDFRKLIAFRWIRIGLWMSFYFLVGVLTLPHIFRGILIFSPGLGIDESFLIGGIPLNPDESSVIQSVYFTIHFFTLCVLYQNNDKKSFFNIEKVLNWLIIIFLILGFELYFETINNVKLLSSILYSNIGYNLQSESTIFEKFRFCSTFTEASYCGAFISASFWYTISLNKGNSYSKLRIVLMFILFLSLLLNLSSTGLVAFVFGALIYSFRLDGSKIVIASIVIVGVFLILDYLDYWGYIDKLILNKFSTDSGKARTGADKFSWDILIETYGLGAGLGTHRGSSFLLNILANVGLLGTYLLFNFFYQILFTLRKYSSNTEALKMFFYVLIIGQFVAIPDLNFQILWFSLFIVLLDSNQSLKVGVLNTYKTEQYLSSK